MNVLACFAAGFLLLAAGGAWAQGPDASATVTHLPEGTLILRPFRNAPYPHASRKDGFKVGERTFPPEDYQDSTVGLFIPAGFQPGPTTDFVVHFHGHLNHVAQVFTQYDLARQFVKSGLNAILVVPQGPKDAQDSGDGHLELDKGGFESLMHEIADYLVATGRIPTPQIGGIALTAHSGGYKVASAILIRGGLVDDIRDVLLFDASYGDLEGFADWAKRGHGRRLVSLFTAHLASANVELMSLLTQRGVKFRVMMEPEATDAVLSPRSVLFLHTVDLEHNDVIAKRDDFARFLRTSALSRIP